LFFFILAIQTLVPSIRYPCLDAEITADLAQEAHISARDQALRGDDNGTTLEQANNLQSAVDPDLEKKAEKSLWVESKVPKWQRVTRNGGKQAAETRAARGRTSTVQRKRKATTKSGTNVQMSTPPDSPTEDDVASKFDSPPQKKRRLIAKSSTKAQVQPVEDKRSVSIGKPPVCAEVCVFSCAFHECH